MPKSDVSKDFEDVSFPEHIQKSEQKVFLQCVPSVFGFMHTIHHYVFCKRCPIEKNHYCQWRSHLFSWQMPNFFWSNITKRTKSQKLLCSVFSKYFLFTWKSRKNSKRGFFTEDILPRKWYARMEVLLFFSSCRLN